MTSDPGTRSRPKPLDVLEALGPVAMQLDRPGLVRALAPLAASLRHPLPAAERLVLAEAVMAFCRRLYGSGRSAEALALGQALLDHAVEARDPVLERRAAGVCGLLAADSVDVVGGLEYHLRALRLAQAEGSATGLAGVWNNIGHALSVTGNYGLAARGFRRALAVVAEEPPPVHVRFTACLNLANAHYHLGDPEAGLRHAEAALREAVPAWAEEAPHAAVLLRRNLVWLLIALGRVEEARPHVEAIAALARSTPATRTQVAAAMATASFEIAQGQADIALTRLEDALARARTVPGSLRDALACIARAEEAAGYPERAMLRLQELSDHVYRDAIDRARGHVELMGLFDAAASGLDPIQEQARARLAPRLRPPGEPEDWKTYQRLGVAAVLRMDGTGWHGIRVGALSKALALARGLPPLQSLEVGLAAELHDIGLASVPEAILAKKGGFTDAERALVERHTEAGAEILRDDGHPRILLARDIARYHHARWDGAGYPERVGGRFIPLPARICAVADAYDSMVCGLDAGPAMTMDEALGELRRGAGNHFDPELVDAFASMIRDETADLGLDTATIAGLESFQELVTSLHDDRGFI